MTAPTLRAHHYRERDRAVARVAWPRVSQEGAHPMSEPRTAESIEALRRTADIALAKLRALTYELRRDVERDWSGVASGNIGKILHSFELRDAEAFLAHPDAALTAYADALKAQTWQGMESDFVKRLRTTIAWMREEAASSPSLQHSRGFRDACREGLRRLGEPVPNSPEVAAAMNRAVMPAPPSDRTEGR